MVQPEFYRGRVEGDRLDVGPITAVRVTGNDTMYVDDRRCFLIILIFISVCIFIFCIIILTIIVSIFSTAHGDSHFAIAFFLSDVVAQHLLYGSTWGKCVMLALISFRRMAIFSRLHKS